MGWLILIAIVAFILFMAAKGKKTAQQEAFGRLRAEFPKIGRLRLIAACPGLDGVLQEGDLRQVFDWIMIQLFRRSNTSSLSGLMDWSIKQGEAKATAMTAEVAREAVDRLPQRILTAIDDCQGREFAAVVLDQTLTEAGERAISAPRRRLR
jgi:hypothetical protein